MGLAQQLVFGLDPTALFERCIAPCDDWQRRLLESKAKRLILNLHRQAGKTSVCSVLILYYLLYERPGSEVLILSPTERQSTIMLSLVAKFSSMLESVPKLIAESTTRLLWANRSVLHALPGGDDGDGSRGFSPDIILVDEASRVSDELFGACRPMIATKPHGRLILLSTPWGARGTFHKLWTEGEGWEKFELKAVDNPRIDPEFLASEKRELSPLQFASEYECQFVSPDETCMWGPELIDAMFNPGEEEPETRSGL
jgi:terminase large subunit-like protein